jgi:glycosyltransferase involved in cell wall biosynthesis
MSAPSDHPRVAYVMTHYPKLAQTFIANEIDALGRMGVEVACFAMNPPEAIERSREGAEGRIARTTYLKAAPLKAVLSLLRQTVRHPLGMARVWNLALGSSGGDVRRAVRRLAHLAQAALVAEHTAGLGITRLHAHFGLAPATIAWLACAISRAQGRTAEFSFTIHGYHDFADPAEARLDLKARDAAAVLCISDFTRSQLCLITAPGLWPKFHVARCGIDLTDFAFRDPPVRDVTPTVLALGRLSPEKGFNILIRAVALAREAGTLVRLRIVGDGPYRGELEDAAKAQGIADCVSFAGELPPDAVREELKAADIFCMASFSEGLPVSLMEAMAIGVPCIATWIAGIPELAENEVTALTVPPARADSLAVAIERLAREPELRLRLARSARERVEQSHELAACAGHVRALLLGGVPA